MAKAHHRGFDNPPRLPDYVSGAEAAAMLGVKRATLYAYASRGLVRSEPLGRGKARRYLLADLERLEARRDARAGHAAVAAGALRFGEPVLESALTQIEDGELRYRGLSVVELARTSSFEAVAELLWMGELPASRPPWRARDLGLKLGSLAALVPDAAHPVARLAVLVPALAAGEEPEARLRGDEVARAQALILRMAALLGGCDRARVERALASPTVAGAVLESLERVAPAAHAKLDRDLRERAVERALVLLADHELNVSAFAVRVTASAGADLHACVSAGLAALSGPLHGGTCDRVEALVRGVGSPAGARQFVRDRMRAGEAIPGFGHPLYPAGDPRFAPIFEAAVELAPDSPVVAVVRALLAAAREAGCGPPAVDIGLAVVALALGLPRGTAASLFAIGRAAGWVAHTLEQRAAGYLLRPRARYVGAREAAKVTPRRR